MYKNNFPLFFARIYQKKFHPKIKLIRILPYLARLKCTICFPVFRTLVAKFQLIFPGIALNVVIFLVDETYFCLKLPWEKKMKKPKMIKTRPLSWTDVSQMALSLSSVLCACVAPTAGPSSLSLRSQKKPKRSPSGASRWRQLISLFFYFSPYKK
jgi:hypothetical protein